MELRVLGCSGAEFPDASTTGLLVDGSLLLDGGTIGAALNETEQGRIRHILVTHAHLDHIKGIPLLADNLMIRGHRAPLMIYGLPATLTAISQHLLNDLIWPDFSRLPTPEAPIIVYRPVTPGEEIVVDGFRVTPWPMQHAVPAVGYRIAAGGDTLFFTGDTGPVGSLWAQIGPVHTLIIEVSFPNEMEELARITGHLTPRLLALELTAMPVPPQQLLISHLKPQYRLEITRQLAIIDRPMRLLTDNAVYQLEKSCHDH
jgi:ribonuclease BN (tRNA processing enzyme)